MSSPYTILIIDDQKTQLGLSAVFLQHSEFGTIEVISCQDAQLKLQQHNIFGILTKWDIIKENPEQWQEQLGEEIFAKQILLFVIADQMAPQEHLAAFHQGAAEVFTHPFLPEELFFRLSAHLMQTFHEAGQLKRLEGSRLFSHFYAELDSLDSDLISRKMLDFLNNELQINWVSLWWYHKPNHELVLGIHSSPEFPVTSVSYQKEDSMWQALEQDKPLLFESALLKEEQPFSGTKRKGLAMVVPMIADGVWLGVANFTNFAPYFFEHYELDDLLTLCNHVTSRLGYALNYQKVLEQDQEMLEKNKKLEELNDELQDLLSIQENISKNLLITSQELAESKKELEELHLVKDDFLAIASHDLRSPLGGIRSAVETVLEFFEVEEDVRELLVPVIGLCNDQLLQVSELLDVAKLEAGRMELEYTALPQDQLIEELNNLGRNLEILTHVKKITLDWKAAPVLPSVSFDIPKIKQVINNLVGNAIKFTPEGGQILIHLHSPEPDLIQITVQDSGIGIKESDLPNIFNKYEQIKKKNVGTDGERGSGLGLAICKNLIELHGGKIWVESEYDQGSQFHFTIPSYPPKSQSPLPTHSS